MLAGFEAEHERPLLRGNAAKAKLSRNGRGVVLVVILLGCFCCAATTKQVNLPPQTGNPLVNPVSIVVKRFHTLFTWHRSSDSKNTAKTTSNPNPNGPANSNPNPKSKHRHSSNNRHTSTGDCKPATRNKDTKSSSLKSQQERTTEPLLGRDRQHEKDNIMSESAQKNQKLKEGLLAQLPDHSVFKNFVDIMQIPRATFKEWNVRQWAASFGVSHGCSVEQDSVGNLRIRRKASPGYENRAKISIQAHMDMVCEKDPGILTNFDNDPIHGVVEDGWLKAKGTTLGADNGIGVAAALALLQEPELRTGQLEILLTVMEENDMIGATNIDENLLDSEILINVDSESAHEICAGSAGGFVKNIERQGRLEKLRKKEAVLSLDIGNLAGGHTGVDIHEGHANAIVVWGRLLNELERIGISPKVASLNGGSAHNAIPRTVTSQIILPEHQLTQAKETLHRYFAEINKEYLNFEDKRSWELSLSQKSNGLKSPSRYGLSLRESSTLVSLILQIPDGIDRMNAQGMEGVESSMTLSRAKLNTASGLYSLEIFARSSEQSRLRHMDSKLDVIAKSGAATASEPQRPFPSWAPKPDSKVLKQALDSHRKLFGKKPKIFSVHAGLETGILAQKYPNLDTISIGPTIVGAHTTNEALKIDTVIPFYAWLKAIVHDMSSKSYPTAKLPTTSTKTTQALTPSLSQ